MALVVTGMYDESGRVAGGRVVMRARNLLGIRVRGMRESCNGAGTGHRGECHRGARRTPCSPLSF